MKKALPYIVVALVLAIGSAILLPLPQPIISLKAEPLFELGPLTVSNSLLTAWIGTIIILVFCFLTTRNMQLRPSGTQNVLEMAVEGLYSLTEGVAGPKWVNSFFTIPATIFIFVFVTNFFGLLIGVPFIALGICEPDKHTTEEVAGAHGGEEALIEEAEDSGKKGLGTSTCASDEHIVPFFRAPAADLNFALALALITQIAAQYFGFAALGFGGYVGKFFAFEGIFKAKSGGDLAMGILNFLVGLIEFLSEFVKVIAYTFRLFGNIFAGEVMLVVIIFLVPLIFVTPLIGFEIFVNFIQAFVFFILSVAFYAIAVRPHSEHEESH